MVLRGRPRPRPRLLLADSSVATDSADAAALRPRPPRQDQAAYDDQELDPNVASVAATAATAVGTLYPTKSDASLSTAPGGGGGAPEGHASRALSRQQPEGLPSSATEERPAPPVAQAGAAAAVPEPEFNLLAGPRWPRPPSWLANLLLRVWDDKDSPRPPPSRPHYDHHKQNYLLENRAPRRSWLLNNLGGGNSSSGPERDAIFAAPAARGLLAQSMGSLSAADGRDSSSVSAFSQSKPAHDGSAAVGGSTANPPAPFWSPRSWAAFSFDLYVRLVDRPRSTRVRIKQSVGVLPFVTLKPALDLSLDPAWSTPARARLDVKAFGCVKWRLRADAPPVLQLRARAPLADPRFTLDILYERNLADYTDSVRVAFRALDWAFLKAPQLGAGVKIPVAFASGVKSTVRIKQFLVDSASTNPVAAEPDYNIGRHSKVVPATGARAFDRVQAGKQQTNNWFGGNGRTNAREFSVSKNSAGSRRGSPLTAQDDDLVPQEHKNGWRLHGPIGIDIKLRLIQFGGAAAAPSRTTPSNP